MVGSCRPAKPQARGGRRGGRASHVYAFLCARGVSRPRSARWRCTCRCERCGVGRRSRRAPHGDAAGSLTPRPRASEQRVPRVPACGERRAVRLCWGCAAPDRCPGPAGAAGTWIAWDWELRRQSTERPQRAGHRTQFGSYLVHSKNVDTTYVWAYVLLCGTVRGARLVLPAGPPRDRARRLRSPFRAVCSRLPPPVGPEARWTRIHAIWVDDRPNMVNTPTR